MMASPEGGSSFLTSNGHTIVTNLTPDNRQNDVDKVSAHLKQIISLAKELKSEFPNESSATSRLEEIAWRCQLSIDMLGQQAHNILQQPENVIVEHQQQPESVISEQQGETVILEQSKDVKVQSENLNLEILDQQPENEILGRLQNEVLGQLDNTILEQLENEILYQQPENILCTTTSPIVNNEFDQSSWTDYEMMDDDDEMGDHAMNDYTMESEDKPVSSHGNDSEDTLPLDSSFEETEMSVDKLSLLPDGTYYGRFRSVEHPLDMKVGSWIKFSRLSASGKRWPVKHYRVVVPPVNNSFSAVVMQDGRLNGASEKPPQEFKFETIADVEICCEILVLYD